MNRDIGFYSVYRPSIGIVDIRSPPHIEPRNMYVSARRHGFRYDIDRPGDADDLDEMVKFGRYRVTSRYDD